MAASRRINELHDCLIGLGVEVQNATLEEFLKWAFSDLCHDATKGVFAEWLVAKILKIPTTRRYAWSNFDLISPRGTKIEVKSGAYWQTWRAINPDGTERDLSKFQIPPDSKIRFAGLTSRDALEPFKDPTPRYKSDLYIFCFQHEKEFAQWNAMDLAQWEFYLVPASALKTKSVNLLWLKVNKFGPFNPKGLSLRFQEYEDSHA